MKLTTALLPFLLGYSQISAQTCQNDDDFCYGCDNGLITCEFIQGNELLRQKLCAADAVRDACPVSCGLCCDDNPTKKFGWASKKKGWIKKKCDWLTEDATKTNSRLKKCNETKAGSLCLLSCNACFDEVASMKN